jgi:SAM-dependent methyltransferase
VAGDTILGIGYAAPYMRQFHSEARRQILCMPEEQGAVRWPPDGPSCSFLSSETELPLPPSSVDRILMVHCLEHCGMARPLLRELWRVLTPEGRLLLVIPNRRGMWARADGTPFGHGHPYSRGQLERLLRDCLYAATGWWPTLFMPPIERRLVLNTAIAWERIGLFIWPAFSGVLIVEAQKHVYALVKGRHVPARAKLQPVPRGATAYSGFHLHADGAGEK